MIDWRKLTVAFGIFSISFGLFTQSQSWLERSPAIVGVLCALAIALWPSTTDLIEYRRRLRKYVVLGEKLYKAPVKSVADYFEKMKCWRDSVCAFIEIAEGENEKRDFAMLGESQTDPIYEAGSDITALKRYLDIYKRNLSSKANTIKRVLPEFRARNMDEFDRFKN